nr:MAG TPA: tail protein-type pyocin [Caudoviricetes sp.]
MAFEDKKGIIVASPFKLQAEALLDVRQQVDTIAERDRLVTLKAATAGLRVFVKENSTSYVYTGSKWDPLATGAPYKHPTGDGNHHVPATGTTNAGKYLKAGATAGSEAWSNIAASDITGLPTRLPNPQVLKFTGAATATYDGSGAVTVNIPTSGTTDASLTLQMNGGTTESTNKFTFNGSAAKTVNITPELIGAAAASHTHPASQITGLPTSLKNPYALTVKTNGTSAAVYDGSVAKEVNITASSVGAAAASHGHSTFKGATASAAGGTGFVPTPGVGENNKYLRGDGTWQPISLTLAALGVTATAAELNYMKGVTSAVQTQLNGKAAASHTHPASQITGLPTKLPNPYALKFTGAATATYDGSGAVTVNIPTAQASPYALIMQFNGGTTEDTNKFTFNGGSAKTVNITPAAIGAAAASHSHSGYAPTNHTHNYAGSGSAGGSANSAVKLATARTINGISFDGTKNIEIPNSYSKQLTSEDLNTLLTPGNYFAAGGNTVKNKPSLVDNFGFEVYKTAAGHIAQKLHGSNNIIYYRLHDGTSFNSWSEIYSSVNKPTPSEIGAADASHTHNYAASSHTHPASQITGLPTSLKNPYALTVKTNGTAAATYDGSAAKEVNITPAAIGAAAASHSHSGYAPTSHTHKIANITDIADAAVASAGGVRDSSNNAKITISYQETSATTFSYIPVFTGATHIGNISKANFRSVIDAAPASHTHNYAGSSSAGGPANSAKKVDVPVGTVMWSTSSSSTFFAATMGGTWEVVGNIDAIINTSTSITFYLHKKKAL